MQKGLIFNIQRFSLHDGPGIRTTVFFKGCPLSCPWCQNPEGISGDCSLFISGNTCIGCGACLEACPEKAVVLNRSGPVIDRIRCTICSACAEACPVEKIKTVGREITVEELVAEILKDKIIFEESGGGTTISGGEPLLQPEFLQSLLSALKKEDIHTAIETSGFAPWAALERAAFKTDLIFYDLKIVDPKISKSLLGISSGRIIYNLRRLLKMGCNVRVRMPYIPSVNDDRKNLDLIAKSLKNLGVSELELVPYHNLGTVKYAGLNLKCETEHIAPPSSEKVAEIIAALKQRGLKNVSEV